MKTLLSAVSVLATLMLSLAAPRILAAQIPFSPQPALTTGAVFTMTNAAAGNQVEMYSRATDGTLTLVNAFSTQGTGSGADLASQGALAVSPNHRYLYVVNAGTNDITAFAIHTAGLTFLNRISSGGTLPVSLTAHGTLVYVVNAAGTPNITGFRVARNGSLTALAGSTVGLSGASAGPAQVSFNNVGTQLVVAEKSANNLDTFSVNVAGIPGPALVQPSAGPGPFGFAFSKSALIVSEVSQSAVSSYSISKTGVLRPITASLVDFGKAACWIVNTNNVGFPLQYSYTTNTGSNSISGFQIQSNGSLTLLNSNGITVQLPTPSKPLDMALDSSSNYLYVLNQSAGNITGFQINSDGSLTQVALVTGLPTTGTYGLAGY